MQNPPTSSSTTPTTSSVTAPSLLTSGSMPTGIAGSPASGGAIEGIGAVAGTDQQQDLRSVTMQQQQQLLQAIQLQQSLSTSSAPSSGGVPANVLALYQQLISQQLSQPHVAAAPTVSQPPGGITGLPQQFNATLQLGSASPTLQRPSTGVQQTTTPTNVFQQAPQNPHQQLPLPSSSSNLNTSYLVSQLLASNPNLLPQLLASGGQQTGTTPAPSSQIIHLILSAIASQQHQQQQQQLQQQQLLQQLLQQNPLAAANVYLYQNLLQQQQQQQQQANAAQPQLNLLMQLATQLTGNQQPLSQLITSWLAQQQQPGHPQIPQQQQTLQMPSATQALPAEIQQVLLRYATKENQQQQHQLLGLEQHKTQTGQPNALTLLQSIGMPGVVDNSGSALLFSTGTSTSSSNHPVPPSQPPYEQPTFLTGLTAEEHNRLQLQSSQQTPGSVVAPERVLTSAESVQDHISRLISENEAIVEPNPMLLKRRPYHRQSTSNSINSQNSQECIGGSQRGSPGSQLPKTNTTRSHSLHESPLLNSLRLGGSLTSGQPIIRSRNTNSLTCNFCNLKFPNEAGLEAHEFRCSKKEQQLTKQHSQPQLRPLPLGVASSHQPQQQLLRQLQQQQQKLLAQQQHQSNIAALVGGGMGVAPDLVLGGGLDGRSASTAEQHRQFLQTMSSLTNATPDELSNRFALKKRLMDASGHEESGGEASSQQNNNMVIDVVSADDDPASASGSKVAKMDYGSDIELLQRLILQKRPVTTTTPALISSNANANEQATEGGSTSTTVSSALSVLQQIADSAATQRQREQQRLLIASQKAIIQKAAAEYAASAAASSGSRQLRRHSMIVDDEREVVELAESSVLPTTTTATASATVTTAIAADMEGTACHEMRGMIAYSIECIAMRGSAALPYLLTLGEKIAQEARGGEMESPTLCSPVTSTPYRNRNITSDTFVCLNKTRPSDVEQKNDGVSAYADCWQRGHVDPDEKWVIANFLSTGSTKPRMITGDNFCYTTANKSSRSLLTTHSTFWELQNRHGIRASAHELAAAIMIDPKHGIAAATANQLPTKLEMVGTSEGCVSSSFFTFETTKPATPGELHYEPVAGRKRSAVEVADNDDTFGDFKTTSKLMSIHVKPKVMKLPATVSKATLEATISRMNVRKEHAKEVEVYVRGRGRGRYVCDRCGIRCKKPSMLKKHLKSHTNDRPYTCITCNFAFKTKGNLTKHLYSKAHRRRMVDSKSRDDRHQYDPVSGRPLLMGAHTGAEREVGRLVMDESEDAELAPNLTELCDAPAIRKLTELEAKFVNDDYWAEDDAFDGDDNNEDEEMLLEAIEEGTLDTGLTYRRFGQENILVERSTHTPPTLWGAAIPKAEMGFEWPKSDQESRCHSAPPVAMCSTEWWPLEAQRPSKRPSSKATRRMDAAKRAEEECGRLEPCMSVTQSQPQPATSSFLLADAGMGVRAQADHHEGGGSSSASQQQLIANFIPQPHFIAQSQATASLNFSLGSSSTPHEQMSQAATIDLNVLKITQPQLAALIASAILGKSDSQSTHVAEQQQSGFILPAFASQPTIVHPPIQQPNDVSALGTFVTAEEYPCTMCDKKFRKESELSLHKQTHIIENRVIAKSRIHCCPECKINLKTKLALSKHLESAHSGSAITAGTTANSNDETAEVDPAAQPVSNAATSQNSSGGGNLGFRSFVCNDCNLGFRSNGVLGKHLRSKNHVKALITQGKLPVDAASLIRDHAYILAKIDASDCESAKSSLISLLERVRDDDIERLSAPQLPKTTSQLPSAINSSLSSSTPTTNTTNAMSLECREHLGSVSPVAPQTTANVTMIGDRSGVYDVSHRLGVKRKNTEEWVNTLLLCVLHIRIQLVFSGIIEAADSQRTSGAHVAYVLQTPNSRVVERPPPAKIFVPMIEGSSGGGVGGDDEEDGDESENYPGSPLYSLANVAVAAAAASHHNSPLSVNSISNSSSIRRVVSNALNNKTMITNVWVPPRMDQVERRIGTPDSASSREASKQMMEAGICREHVGSNRSAEETSSISTGRSESATPILRSGASINVGGSNGVTASPVPAITVITHCQLCDADFPTPTDLQVHFHTDHVVMRDGKDYKCPRYNCDRVYPSRETLRLHIIAHYFGGGAAAPDDEPGIADSPSDSASCCGGASSPALRKKSSVLHTPTVVIPSAPVQSPGAPEETHTSKRVADSGTKQQANRKQGSALRSLGAVNHITPNTTPGSEQKVRCHICGHLSENAAELNSHHLSAHCGTKLS